MVRQLISYNQLSTILSFVNPWVLLKYIWEVTWPLPLRISLSLAMAWWKFHAGYVVKDVWSLLTNLLFNRHMTVITLFYRSCEQMAEFPILPADSCDDVISWVSDSFCSQCLNKNQRHCQSYLCSTLCVPNGTLFRKSYHCKVFLFELNQCISIYTIMVYVH